MAFVVGPLQDITRCAPGNHVQLNGTDDGAPATIRFQLSEITELLTAKEVTLTRRTRVLLRLYFRGRDAAANTWAEMRNAWANFSFEV